MSKGFLSQAACSVNFPCRRQVKRRPIYGESRSDFNYKSYDKSPTDNQLFDG